MSLVAPTTVRNVSGQTVIEKPDLLAVEEPLEIRLGFGPIADRQQRSLAVTMRTPGHDAELAMGFLFTEGIIHSPNDIVSCRHCVQDVNKEGNVIRVELQPEVTIDWSRLERSTMASASCGLCGKTTIDAIRALTPGPVETDFSIEPSILHALPDHVRETQRAYAYTGGIHAAALFDAQGKLLLVREDIGRHNALDKLIGAAFWQNWLPLHQYGIFLSGRVGVELVQKSWMAGVPLLAAVGAPSSLAVQMTQEANITLAGFVRDERFNLYSQPDRVRN
ncbi:MULTISPECIES: formate dehydrogenase accessory sulfurtransferase FdhD [unclassified Spirosoma]|uniref:formate dehydrogenase accessory sulfurtransferase FdhD n=1 Tax=unclassified Spirosoma TaxID=2621999 RepID=UPI000964B582|nr:MULTISPECIES: formate dehydrogenase accessory sulfurtransferase FdhD [unclassified Spirosoma]MBN8821900.1 formate dehydrogenase accessory sulfurtransferase FdhD [Spirosoma sp.]OJW80617.1 MAG: formate dehydrogenase family accessory protein FdhD [Spirosoma sp. 48-14]